MLFLSRQIMMKLAIILNIAFCLAVVVTAGDNMDNKYDSVDVDAILGNPRVLTNYIKCLMDQGPCTKEGRQLKSKYNSVYSVPSRFHAESKH